eukprot:403334434
MFGDFGNKQQTPEFENPLQIDLNNIMVKKNLALISNDHLSKFIINNGQDNALTFAMRVGNYGVFRFLLNKGVSVLAVNQDGKTAVHAAIEIERIECLAYLFEADNVDLNDFSSIMEDIQSSSIDQNYLSKLSNKQHIWKSFQALDCKMKPHDYLPFHLAVLSSNHVILRYMTKIYKLRDFIKFNCQRGQFMRREQQNFDQVKEMPATKDKLTPLLVAAQHSQFSTFMYLLTELNCNIEATSSNQNNCMHIAVLNKNQQFIQRLAYYDADYGILRNARNAQNKSPADLNQIQNEDWLMTIWDRVKQGNIQKIRELHNSSNNSDQTIQTHINSQTSILGNTPLHIALKHQQTLVIRTILQLGADPLIKNYEGQSCIDIAIKHRSSEYVMQLLRQSIMNSNLSGLSFKINQDFRMGQDDQQFRDIILEQNEIINLDLNKYKQSIIQNDNVSSPEFVMRDIGI